MKIMLLVMIIVNVGFVFYNMFNIIDWVETGDVALVPLGLFAITMNAIAAAFCSYVLLEN